MENWAYLTDFLVVKLQCRTESSLSVVPCWGPHVVQYNEDREWTICDFCCLLWAENLNVSLIGFETSVSWYYNKKNSEYTTLKKNHREAWWSSFLENYNVSFFFSPWDCSLPLSLGESSATTLALGKCWEAAGCSEWLSSLRACHSSAVSSTLPRAMLCARGCAKTKVSRLVMNNSMALFMALGVNSVNWLNTYYWPDTYLNNYTLPSAEHVPGSSNWKIFFCFVSETVLYKMIVNNLF